MCPTGMELEAGAGAAVTVLATGNLAYITEQLLAAPAGPPPTYYRREW